MGYALKTQAEVDNYMSWWWGTINSLIAHKFFDKTLADYPDAANSFEKMKKAWQASFEDGESLEKIYTRDSAMIELSNALKKILN